MSFEQCIFPDSLKMTELAPVFKEYDKMNKNNFRPVSVLPCISKVFEHVYCNQMMTFLNEILAKFLAAFRNGDNWETVLVTMIEEWKKHCHIKKSQGLSLSIYTKPLIVYHIDYLWPNYMLMAFLKSVVNLWCRI